MISPLLLAARSERVRRLVTGRPVTRRVVDRFVAGETVESAVRATRALTGAGLAVTLDHLGEDVRDPGQAEATRDAYLRLCAELERAGLSQGAEASVKLSALGLRVEDRLALDNARRICEGAERAGMAVTVDMEDHTTVDSTLDIVRELRTGFPGVGVAVQAMLRRSEGDLRDLAGTRVRLVKGAYAEPASVAYPTKAEVDRAYVRGLRLLLREPGGYPMVASHDPRMIELALWMARDAGREPGTYEFQMLYGIRGAEQKRLAGLGERMRVYVPYGSDWYGYFMRRLAERPANLAFFLRSFVSR
ncbi:proline dehydrogenase [Actinomadura sp. NBRC 104412]|nr:proline dehydrogenase [Actinomadura sp. NBRC 104412]